MNGLSGGGLTVNVDAPVSVTQERGNVGYTASRKEAERIGHLVKSIVKQEVTKRLKMELSEGGILHR